MKNKLIEWLARRLPDCDATTKLLSAAMDQELSLKQRIQARLHLWMCVYCRRYQDQLQLLRTTVRERSVRDSQSGPSLPADARERMKRRLSQP